MNRPTNYFLALLALSFANINAPAAEVNSKRLPPAADHNVDFVNDVQPILRANCFECHSGEVEEGELNLGVREKAAKGGEHGVVFLVGDSAASSLIHLVSGLDKDRMMPPEDNDPLTKQEIGILRAWIDQGAKWPDEADVLDPRIERAKTHWAFKRLQNIDLPKKRDEDTWSQNEIDLFIDRRRSEEGLAPSTPASARTLVRRLYFDLIGLPPTPEQTSQFVNNHKKDPSTATSELVDRLLSSDQYGERWARHWLDVARYADSAGQEADEDRPHAFRYRDFVIQSFNEDMPYDQFVKWQIAGDEYEPNSDAAVSATGFLTSGTNFKLADSFLEEERLRNRYNELDDIISTLGTGMLGLTVGCARCHDHKYDAFSAREYYQLLGVFHSGDRKKAKLPSGKDGFFFQDFDAKVRPTWLFRRSDFYDREIELELGFPQVVSEREAGSYWTDAKAAVEKPNSTLQRRALAEWMTDTEKGGGALLARVFVNRIWQNHFGHGLVRTPSDFGVRGDAPTHPELLEYLTKDFVENGWRMKRLHREILTSAVWQQSNGPKDSTANKKDPDNKLLWKMAPQRLQAEALRDAMLSISGTLNLESYGPGFKPFIQPEANLARNIQGEKYPKDAKDEPATRRRSIYMFHKRLIPYPLFQAFDRPDLMNSCAQRQNTTVAPQAMAILNDKFVRTVARDFARQLIKTNGSDDKAVARASFEHSFARPPSESELDAAVGFVQTQIRARESRNETDVRREAIADYCHSLFGLNEFIYVD